MLQRTVHRQTSFAHLCGRVFGVCVRSKVTEGWKVMSLPPRASSPCLPLYRTTASPRTYSVENYKLVYVRTTRKKKRYFGGSCPASAARPGASESTTPPRGTQLIQCQKLTDKSRTSSFHARHDRVDGCPGSVKTESPTRGSDSDQ